MRMQVMEFTDTAMQDTDVLLEFPNQSKEAEQLKEEINTEALSSYKQKKRSIQNLENITKRLIDICGGIVGLMILIPLTVIIYIANRLQGDKGPIFFTQDRIGKDGKTFKMLKYRSMVIGAEEKLKEYLKNNEEARIEYKKYKKLKNDPRITKIGDFLRKTSLDEMPQLLLLLNGKMSLVGPRPYLPDEIDDMGEYYNIIIKMKPGITGYWQVSGRSEVTFDDRLDMDVVYSKNRSLKEDIKILLKTVMHVIKKEGAI